MQDGRDFVFQQMISAHTSQQHKRLSINDFGNFDQVKRYGDLVQEFLNIMFLLVHFTSGQPGRLTEVASIQITNTVDAGIRNISRCSKDLASGLGLGRW